MQDLEFRQLIERLKLRSPIEEIVRERVPELKKRGALWQARCPFHEERTPSFTVDPRRGTWHCWGACGEGGDVIGFLERFEGVGFLDAVRILARNTGEELPERLLEKRRSPGEGKAEERYDVLRRAAEFYRRSFLSDEGREAREYIEGRGLASEILESFGVGWSPREGSPILDHAKRAGVRPELLIETGLVKRSEGGRAFDFFRGRLMIPIRDRMGRTVGFGGRVLPADEVRSDGRPQAKYVNTAETPLFLKGRLIFGLDLAIADVRRSKELVLVEGYTDVMALHQAGARSAAAVLGTSTTEDHAALVRRTGAKRVTLLFDGDEAGRMATRRALAGLLPLGIDLHVAVLEPGQDPCDLALSEGGSERLGALLRSAPEWYPWALTELAGLSGPALAAGVDRTFDLLARIEKPVEVSSRLRELSRALGLPEEDIRTQWRLHRDSPGARAERRVQANRGERSDILHPARHPSPPSDSQWNQGGSQGGAPAALPVDGPEHALRPVDPALETAFELLLGALLLDNSLIPVYGDLEPDCPEGELRTLFRMILALDEDLSSTEPIHAGRLLTLLGDDPARHRVMRLEHCACTAESPTILARDQERWLQGRRHRTELQSLRRALAEANQVQHASGDSREEVLRSLHETMKRRQQTRASSSESPTLPN